MRELSKIGLRYKKHASKLPGTPDIAFSKNKLVVFLDSCFWHGCRWHGSKPSTNVKYWRDKISVNKKRDKNVNLEYKTMGWKVLRYWEHQIKRNKQEIVSQIEKALQIR